jgi:transposase-like protein
MGSPSSAIRLPRNWTDHVKSAFLQALGMAHMAMAQVRGRCTDSVATNADNERLRSEVELLREQLRIKGARMARLPARHRPRYSPTDRLAILQLKASRGWNEQQAATGFFISAATVASWLRRVDEKGAESLVQAPRPVNRYPDFVDHLVQRLKLSFPAMGKVRIAQLLGRAGLLLAATAPTLPRHTSATIRWNPPRVVVPAAESPRSSSTISISPQPSELNRCFISY